MNDSITPSPSETQEPVKPAPIVRLFIILLPVGLAFMVPISLWIYYQKKNQTGEATSEFASMLRRELNAEDFARYQDGFVSVIGDRSASQPDNQEAAASYVESTMGTSNMGYNVQRLTFTDGNREVAGVVATLPGKSGPSAGAVLVVADYDTPDATGISTLMCVAHSLVGNTPPRTLCFAAVAQADSPEARANGVAQLATQLAESGTKVTTLVLLRAPLASMPPAWEATEVIPLAAELKDQNPTPLSMLKRIKEAVESAADNR